MTSNAYSYILIGMEKEKLTKQINCPQCNGTGWCPNEPQGSPFEGGCSMCNGEGLVEELATYEETVNERPWRELV